MKHNINPKLLGKQVEIALVGAGGSGSRMLEYLMNLHRAMLALGHPYGLRVALFDDDRVTEANVGRQAFYRCDIGSYKALTLINRANMAMGSMGQWTAHVQRIGPEQKWREFDIIIGAVDNRTARQAILQSLTYDSSLQAAKTPKYWLDMGNNRATAQVVLGEVFAKSFRNTAEQSYNRLPHAGELFPELINAEKDAEADDTPSCSLAEALEKQALYINPCVALFASNLLWNLFTKGSIEEHGAHINLDTMRVMPISIDHATWKRYGVKRRLRKT